MSEARISHVQIRRPSVMLVRIDPGQEPPGLELDRLPYQLLRVRHPLPACTRMAVMRPAVELVGYSVQPRDFVLLLQEADAIGATIVLVHGLVTADGLTEWVLQTVGDVQTRREGLALSSSA
jgi:hypothetical protein